MRPSNKRLEFLSNYWIRKNKPEYAAICLQLLDLRKRLQSKPEAEREHNNCPQCHCKPEAIND